MNRALVKKYVGEAWWLFFGSALLLFGFCWVRAWIVSTLETTRFANVVNQLWDKWGHFSPVPLEDLLSYPGRVAMTFVEPIVVFTIAIWAISRGSDAVSGELSRGTMEVLLAQPIRRTSALATQAMVTIVGMALLCAVTWAGVWVGVALSTVEEEPPPPTLRIPFFGDVPLPFIPQEKVRAPMLEKVDPNLMIPAIVNLFAMGFCTAGFTTLLSACDRYRWRTVGAAAAIYILQFVIKGFALSAKSLLWMKQFTFFTAFEPQWFVSVAVRQPQYTWAWLLPDESGGWELGPMAYNGILLGIGLAGYLLAAVVFAKRDLPAPL